MKFITKTIENDEEYLRQRSEEVDFEKDDYKKYVYDLKCYCLNNEEHKVLALAAIQMGIPKRLVYIRNTNVEDLHNEEIDEARVLINPNIISRKGKTKYWETCASCLDNMGLVTRPYEIVVEYYDIDQKIHRDTFIGFESTVLSHELDHLDGVLHMDIAEKNIVMPVEERKVFRKTHNYEIISKDCEFK